VLRDLKIVTSIKTDGGVADVWDTVHLNDGARFKAVFYGVRKDWTVQGPVTVDGVDDLWVYKVFEFTKENEVLGTVIFDDIPDIDDVKKVSIRVDGLIDDGFTWSYAPTEDEIVYEV
jgi:hypothetical protein